MLCEMQSVSSKTWTRVTISISYGDNHYTYEQLHYSGNCFLGRPDAPSIYSISAVNGNKCLQEIY